MAASAGLQLESHKGNSGSSTYGGGLVVTILTILACDVLLGLDSLVVSVPVGPVANGRMQRNRLAVTFGVSDRVATDQST
jgi:hypothetical protein